MQTYQVRVFPRDSFVYGGAQIALGNAGDSTILIVKNDRFGEAVRLVAQSQEPTQQVQTKDLGILEADQALTVKLQYVLRVEAKTLRPNLDTTVSCTITDAHA
jgi:hypothetical protein